MAKEKVSRRNFIIAVSGAAGVLAVGGIGYYLSRMPAVIDRSTKTTTFPPVATSARTALSYSSFDPRLPSNFSTPLRLPAPSEGFFGIIESPSEATITVKPSSFEILPGIPTETWIYEVPQDGKSVINPILRLKRGEKFRATLANGIRQKTIIHWHGLIVDWKNDGHPSYAIDQGQDYDYDFTVYNRGGTYWYHPHPYPAAEQVYKGLAGFFIVEDADDENLRRGLDLELGKTDIPLAIQDKRFRQDGALEYNPNQNENFMGFLGDLVLANLTPNPYLEVDTRIYRFRILNGSTARIYKLAFMKNGERLPSYLIGVDAGLLESPSKLKEVFLAPAERVDILLDMRGLSPQDTVFLKSLEFDSMHMEETMMGMTQMEGGSELEEGEDFHILKLIVKNKVTQDVQIPDKLSTLDPISVSGAPERSITLSSSMGSMGTMTMGQQMNRWLINGYSFDMYSSPIDISRDRVEVWKITNSQQSMPHPMHIHGYHFRVLERLSSPQQVKNLAVDKSGRLPTDLGLKDTVLLWPGETVRAAIDFRTRFAGEQMYTFHCHNLEHEDNGMMINYKVT